RRTFLRTSGATLAAAVMAGRELEAGPVKPLPNRWKKAFMLGELRQGSPLPTFQLLKEAGFEGDEPNNPNQLHFQAVLNARNQTGRIINAVRGTRHWRDSLSDPDPRVVERGMAAIRQEFDDCRAYGGTTVLVVPAVVNQKVGYRDAYKRSQANIRKLIPDAE